MEVFFVLLLAVSALVLLTACANTANLLLARAAARHKEIATRRAVGAGPGRLIRQLLAESVLLSVLGGALGYLLANGEARYFGTLRLPMALPIDCTVSLDYRVLLFCTALSFATGLVFGLAPALYAVRQDLVGGLKDRPPRLGRSTWRSMRNLLMVGQVAICMVLLVCSGLFLRTLQSSRYADTGMKQRNLLLIGFDPFLEHDRADREHLIADILRRAQTVPGVESAAITSTVPLSLAGVSGSISAGDGPDRTGPVLESDIYAVSPGFFETLGIRLVAGEDFRQTAAASDEIILNRAAAERLFPTANPIGRRIRLDGEQSLRVRAVVANTKSRMMVESSRPCVYRLLRTGTGGGSLTGLTLLARTRGNPAGFVSELSASVRAADRGLALFDIRTMDQQVSNALLLQRAGAFLFGLAGAMGLVIAATGLYGLVSFVVAGQSKEFGIRMALGARRGQILAGVLGRGMKLTVVGVAAGLLLAIALGQGISSLLYGVSSTDGVTLATVALFLFLTTAFACIVPAVRAANVAPAISVRGE
jgi:predicted permease